MLGLGGFQPPLASTSLDLPRQPPKSSAMLGLGGFQPPGLRAPLTTPEIERDARFEGFSTPWASSSLDNPRNRARCSVWGVFDFPELQPPSTTLNNPRNRARCSVLGVFDLPGLRAPLTTPEIEHNARFWGFSTFLGFDNSRQPPKSSAMLGLGGFRPP